MASKLSASAGGFDFARARPNSQIASVDVDDFTGCLRLNRTAAVAVGHVNPVVEAPFKAVDAVLLIAFDESGIQHVWFVRSPSPSVSFA